MEPLKDMASVEFFRSADSASPAPAYFLDQSRMGEAQKYDAPIAISLGIPGNMVGPPRLEPVIQIKKLSVITNRYRHLRAGCGSTMASRICVTRKRGFFAF